MACLDIHSIETRLQRKICRNDELIPDFLKFLVLIWCYICRRRIEQGIKTGCPRAQASGPHAAAAGMSELQDEIRSMIGTERITCGRFGHLHQLLKTRERSRCYQQLPRI